MAQPINPYAPPASARPPAQAQLVAHPSSLSLALVLRGDPNQIRELLWQLLNVDGWSVSWEADGWSGMATKGNKLANFALGALAQYYELRFAFQAMVDGTTTLTLYRVGSGCMGGLLGVYRVRKSFRETSSRIHAELAQRGVVLSASGH